MSRTRTVSVFIQRAPDEVYDYLRDPARFPQWSGFIHAIWPEGEDWVANTSAGTVRIRFTPWNAFRVLDHEVVDAAGQRVAVPLRVLAAPGEGSEVIFTVFRLETMDDAQYEADVRLVLSDLENLKRVLEQGGEAEGFGGFVWV